MRTPTRDVGAGRLAGRMNPPAPRYWIHTLSLEHVLAGTAGGHTEADNRGDARLRHLARGDAVAFYSPRATTGAGGRGGRPLQQFTALGEVLDDECYRVELAPGSATWRRRVAYEDVRPVPVRAVLPMLGFVSDEQRWTLPFRRGLLEVTAGDFGVVAGALRDAATMDDTFSASGRRADR